MNQQQLLSLFPMANKITTIILKTSVTLWLFCVTLSAPTIFAQSTGDPTMLPDGRTIQTPGVIIPTESTPQQYVPLAPIDTDPGIYQVNNFGAFLNGMMKILISLGAVLAVLLIVIGGFQYITSASEGGKGSAKERIENALIGLAILLGSYLILNTINPDLVNTQLMVQQIAPSGLGTSQTQTGNPIIPGSTIPGQGTAEAYRIPAGQQNQFTIPQSVILRALSGDRTEYDQIREAFITSCSARAGYRPVIEGAGSRLLCVPQ